MEWRLRSNGIYLDWIRSFNIMPRYNNITRDLMMFDDLLGVQWFGNFDGILKGRFVHFVKAN